VVHSKERSQEYLILRRPYPRSCFFKQPQLQRLLAHDLLQVAHFLAKQLHLVRGGGTCRVTRQPLLASFEEFLRPVVIQALSDAFAAAQRGDRLLTA
jgi:hypothetical protein